MPSRTRRTAGGLCLLAALVVALLALFASSAVAAPTDPVMGLAELDAKLAESPNGTLQGYLKTVWRGSAIATVPVEVQAVTLGSQTGPESMSSLILFEASGPMIDKYGGIVQGMSGSPIYVDDEGTPKLVGALSYGEAFTKGGAGLATPIEAMSQLEVDYAQPLLAPLSTPVQTESGLKTRVMVVPDTSGLDASKLEGTFVAKPLASLFLGGVNTKSGIYKTAVERLKSRGYDVVPMGAPSSPAKASFSTDFDPGSSVAALATWGDLWYGGIGTTTYSNGPTVLAFGHPMFWDGDTGLFMSNAWIDGVWPSDVSPYKIGSVSALRGTITQDRGTAVMGTTSFNPTSTPVTAEATNVDTGKTWSSEVLVARHAMGSELMDFDSVPALAAYVAGSRAFDVYWPDGSATTTTTIAVTDGSETFKVVRANVFDSTRDIASAAVGDVYEMVDDLRAVNNNGVGKAEILSVNVESSMSRKHNKAVIVDVQTPNGLKVGPNKVVVSYMRSGVAATQTVEMTMSVPAGTSLDGELVATSQDPSGYGMSEFLGDGSPDYSGPDRRTLAEAVDALNAAATNNTIQVRYYTMDSFVPSGGDSPMPSAASVSKTIPCYVSGYIAKGTSTVTAEVSASTIHYGGLVFVAGAVDGATGGTVQIYRRYSNETSEVLVATAPIESFEGDTFFEAEVAGSTKNFQLRVHYDGDSETLASETRVTVKVAAKVALKATPTSARYGTYVTLKATMLPSAVAGNIVFERLVSGRWTAMTTKAVSAGSASYRFKPTRGTWTYRARYLGGVTNAAGTSGSVRVVIK